MCSKHEQVVANYLQIQFQPKAFPEILKDLDMITPVELKDALEKLVKLTMVIRCQCVSSDLSIYWRTQRNLDRTYTGKSEPGHNLKTLKVSRCLPSSTVHQPFKSPAIAQRSNMSVTPVHLSSSNCSKNGRGLLPRKPAVLGRSILHLRSNLKQIEEEIVELASDYNVQELQVYIAKLHEYNEIKDAGQTLLGNLAEAKGTTTSCMYSRYNLDLNM